MIYLSCIALYKFNQVRGMGVMADKMDKDYMRQLAEKNKRELEPLLKYLTWLEKNKGSKASTNYDGRENGNNTMSFPIYDSTLLSFVKEAGKTTLMDKNYVYVYSRLCLQTPADEKQAIERASLQDWNVLCGILTKYVRGGMTQSYLWTQGMEEGIFYLVIAKMKEVVEYWDKPLY